MRKLVGRIIEWFLSYKHDVTINFVGIGVTPRVGYHDDAGYDLYVSKTIRIMPNCVSDVSTGVIFDPKDRLWFEIKARSSTFKKRGLEVQDAVIDKGYRGEMFAVVYNPTDNPVVIAEGERICQVVPHRLIPCTFKVGVLSDSCRKTGGFGSSGR